LWKSKQKKKCEKYVKSKKKIFRGGKGRWWLDQGLGQGLTTASLLLLLLLLLLEGGATDGAAVT
jgi:hypothetical protein